jgi:RNA polymerase sigma-70 factor (ECF subfamily)
VICLPKLDATTTVAWPPDVLAAVAAAGPSSDGGGLLGALWQRGRRAWPTVDIDPLVWGRHLAGVVQAGGTLTGAELGRLHAEDFYLACGCALGKADALAAFDRSFLAQVPVLLGHMRLPNGRVEEVGQVLREKLLVGTGDRPGRIGLYAGQGSLLAWLRITAVRTALNLGSLQDEKAIVGSVAEDQVIAPQDPEHALIIEQQRRELFDILRDAIRTLPPEQRKAIRLQLCDGMTGDDIAARLSVTRSTVVRWLAAARNAILKETQRLFRERLDISRAELDNLVAETRSRLDLRLSQLLTSAPDVEAAP